MSVSGPCSPSEPAPSAGERDRLAVPAVIAAIVGAGGTLLLSALGMLTGVAFEGGISVGIWFLGQSVLSLLVYAAATAGLVMGVVVATRSPGSRKAGYAAIGLVVGVGLLMHLFGIVRAVVLIVQGH
jgi:hypothetical protein